MEQNIQLLSNECQLPLQMASLQIDQNSTEAPISSSNISEPDSSKERLRRRTITTNRRVTSQPKKWISSDTITEQTPGQYYLLVNKLSKKSHLNLETIFEEPNEKLNKLILLGTRKMKRALNFSSSPTPKRDIIKSRKRHAKIKKFFAGKSNMKKVSDEEFGKKMKMLIETLD